MSRDCLSLMLISWDVSQIGPTIDTLIMLSPIFSEAVVNV